MRFDTVVVGAGLAGLTAALRLAEAGRSVALVARGIGATHLSPPTIDVLGYDGGERVESPARALAGFAAGRPEHPYARLPAPLLEEAAAWLRDRAEPLQYTGSFDENLLLPTALGAAKPSALVPASLAAGDLRRGGRFVFVGFRALKDFYPALLAANVARAVAAVEARAVDLELPVGEADVNSLGLGRRFEDGGFRAALAGLLAPRLEPGEAVGFPAALGLESAPAVFEELQERLGRPVFEVPTLPPSLPGMRLYEALTVRLRRAGGRIVVGGPVAGFEAASGRVSAVSIQAAARPVAFRARSFVLASGGFSGRGLELDSRGVVRETVLGLPVAGLPAEGRPRFAPDLFGEQPLARAGIAVDDALRPLGLTGHPVYENVHAAGAVLAGAEPWREASGNGIALGSGYAAASAILAEA